ncbi:dendritic cell-specific transmembrane protein [Narcine bancroftii]|uniref:dendritic cell-specific transmembrane protein n=1 Tax=Narcine bancroftii TaxID=1343680 RepID=UPI003831F1BC
MSAPKIVTKGFGDLFQVLASERKSSTKNILCLISFCLLLSMGVSGIIYVSLQKLECSLPVALAMCGAIAVIVPGALFLSKYLRCFTLIFLISCGTNQGRNALITAGTSAVIFNCAQNSFHNLRELVEYLNCFQEAMLSTIRDHLSKYVEVIKWICQQISKIPRSEMFSDFINISFTVHDDDIKVKLNETRKNIEILANRIISSLNTFTRVCKTAVAVSAVLLILLFTWFYIRSFLTNVKFKNSFVTKQFLQFDEKQKELGKPCLIQLTDKEKKSFMRIPALCVSEKEVKSMARFLIPISTYLFIWITLILLDYGVFYFIDSIRHHIDHLPTISINLEVIFSEMTAVIGIRSMHKYQNIFSNEITWSKGDCILHLTPSVSKIWIELCIIMAVLMLLTLISAKLTMLKVMVLSLFYKNTEEDRVKFLHERILQKRQWATLFNEKEQLNPVANLISFWFPIFKMKQNQRKQQKWKNKIIYDKKYDEVHIEP